MTHARRQRGTVLIAVIWGVFVLSTIAFALGTLVRTGTEELRARKEQLQAHYVARGAIYRVLPLLTAPATENALLAPGQRSLAWQEAGMNVQLELFDENGRLDVNSAPEAVLEQLFSNLGMSRSAAHDLVAGIEDWRDVDDQTRLGGAEAAYYRTLEHPYTPANRDFGAIEELLLVRGVTPELFWGKYVVNREGAVERRLGFVDCLTVNSHQQQININYAPREVLMAAPHMTDRVADWILEGRAKKPFTSVSQFVHDYPVLLSPETLGALTTGTSGRYTLVASAVTASGVTARVRSVVQVSGFPRREGGGVTQPGGLPFAMLEWDDSYVQ